MRPIRLLVEAIHSRRSLLPLAAETAAPADLGGFSARVAAITDELRSLALRAGGDEAASIDIELAMAFADRLRACAGEATLIERTALFNAPRLSPE